MSAKPLWKAAEEGDLAEVCAQLDAGADTEQRCEKGRTALMYGAIRGNRAMVQLLLSRGADKNAKDKKRKTAENLASPEVMQIIYEWPQVINK